MAINVNGFDGMIAGSLGLSEPWYVSRCYVDKNTMSMHIHVSVREGAAISCPKCGGETRRYGYEKEERTWQHGNVFFIYSCYVHCRRPRVLYPRCGAHFRGIGGGPQAGAERDRGQAPSFPGQDAVRNA